MIILVNMKDLVDEIMINYYEWCDDLLCNKLPLYKNTNRIFCNILKHTCKEVLDKYEDCLIVRDFRKDKLMLEDPAMYTKVVWSFFKKQPNYIDFYLHDVPNKIESLDEFDGDFIESALKPYNYIIKKFSD